MGEKLTFKRMALFFIGVGAWHVLVTFVPDAIILFVFCRIPATLAAAYYGAPLDTQSLTFVAHGVAQSVMRVCAATDFFGMLATLFLFGAWWCRYKWLGILVALPMAWLVTLVANTVRLILLVPVTAFVRAALPERFAAAAHLYAGLSVFFPIFCVAWYIIFIKRGFSHERV